MNPWELTHDKLADMVEAIVAILWQEQRLRPDDPRQLGPYWNPAKEWDFEMIEEIAEVLDDLRPADLMPVEEVDDGERWTIRCEDHELPEGQ